MINLNFRTISREDFHKVINAIDETPDFTSTQRSSFLGYLDIVIRFNQETNANPLVNSQNIFTALQNLKGESPNFNTVNLINKINSSYKTIFETYEISFQEVLKEIDSVIKQANTKLSDFNVPTKERLALVDYYINPLLDDSYRGPIAVLIPETHMSDNPDNLVRDLQNITVRSLKQLNIILLEELLRSNERLKIKLGLTETGMDKSTIGVNLQECIQQDTLEAINAFAYLGTIHNIRLIPAETLEPCIKQGLIYPVFKIVKKIIDGLRVSLKSDISPLFEYVDNRPDRNSDNNTSLNIIRTQAKEVMHSLGTNGLFTIEENQYISLNRDNLPRNLEDLITLERKLFNGYNHFNPQRDLEIATSFARARGIIPMIIGSDHLKERLIDKLKEFNIPIIIIGAQGYKEHIKIS